MTRRRWNAVDAVVVVALMAALVALATVALADRSARPTADEQAHDIAASLHCPVCKDLSAADSPAPLARQMRAQIRERLADGAGPAEIRQEFVASYGTSVLMSPPDHGWGRAVNLAPLALLAGAALVGAGVLRRGLRSPTPEGPNGEALQLDDESRRRLEDALAQLSREEP